MGYRRFTGIFMILCILYYFAYTYWGWDQVFVLALSMVSGAAALICLALTMIVRPDKKRRIDRG